jgi:2,4-dienoyl-CoA reductase-like NADH-dependent reductase (Old Yellow Enzyme family)
VVGVRISASENLPEGFDPHYAKRVAKRCEEEGADYIHLSDGSYEKFNDFLPNKEGQVMPKAVIIKEGLNIPLICPSVHDPENVVDVLTTGKADMVSMGRQQIADPEWVNKVKEGRIKDIIRCTRCNIGCITRFALALPCRCILNPTVGQEQFMDEYMKRPILPIKERVWQTLKEIGKEPSSPVK